MKYPDLLSAARHGDLPRVKKLIKEIKSRRRAKEVNRPATDGTTALHHACAGAHVEVVSYLLSIDGINTQPVDHVGWTPLHFAATHSESAECVELLTEQLVGTEHAEEQHGCTALHIASFHGCMASVEALLNLGANPMARDLDGETPLHKAAFAGHSAICYYLVRHCQVDLNSVNRAHRSAAHLAAANRRSAPLRFLVDQRADINIRDDAGNMPLHYAILAGDYECCLALVGERAVLDAPNNQNQSPLGLAVEHKRRALARLLLDEGADVCLRYRTGHGAVLPGLAELQLQSFTDEEVDLMEHEFDFSQEPDRFGYLTRVDESHPSHQVPPRSLLGRAIHTELRKQQERERKWSLMLERFFRTGERHRKMVSRTYKGIPDRMRGSAWMVLSGASIQVGAQKGRYAELMQSPGSQYVKQIDLDIARTERDHELFVHRFSSGQTQLFNVLRAYSIYNSDIGYCQGMSGLTAMLLSKLNKARFVTPAPVRNNSTASSSADLSPAEAAAGRQTGKVDADELPVVSVDLPSGAESEAGDGKRESRPLPVPEECGFWLLDTIVHGPQFSMNDLYVPGFPMLFQAFQIHEHLLQQHLPRVALLFQQQGLATSMYATKWYLLMFQYQLPREVVLRVWDLFFLEGYRVAFCTTLAVLKLEWNHIRHLEFEGLMDHFRLLETSVTLSPDRVVKLVRRYLRQLTDTELTNLRTRFPAQSR